MVQKSVALSGGLWGECSIQACSMTTFCLFVCLKWSHKSWLLFSNRIQGWLFQKHKACFPHCCLHKQCSRYISETIFSFHILYHVDTKSSLGCIHCYLIPSVTIPATHTYTFPFQHSTYPACKVASIFHNASCNIVRYGPWFHLCGAVVPLLSVPEWNSCGSMLLLCQSQTDGLSACCREQWATKKLW